MLAPYETLKLFTTLSGIEILRGLAIFAQYYRPLAQS
jgi:hypothetical protein